VAIRRVIAAIFCMFLSSAATARQVAAQSGSTPHSFSSATQGNASEEITFGGSIQQTVAANPKGMPVGLNLLMDGSRGVLYVNLGPYIRPELKQSLQPGQSIQVVGTVHSFNGQNYLMARQLTVGAQTIDVRSLHVGAGHAPASSTATAAPRNRTSQLGGAR
jgi:hypothetical protein